MVGVTTASVSRASRGHIARAIALTAFFCLTGTTLAEVKLGSPFVDHAVLQRDRDLPVWGTGDVNADVKVTIADQEITGKADGSGKWKVVLKPLKAGGPYTLTATVGQDKATADDILAGDVFLCSGQSNMQYSLKESADGAVVADQAGNYPKLRLGKVNTEWKDAPATSVKIAWENATPKSARDFSAVAYYTAHELLKNSKMTDVPIGLLSDCLGATVIESWLPKETLAEFDPKELQSSMFGIKPTALYNGMIAPLGPIQLTGVMWYQGEGNAGEPVRYRKLLPKLFETWRAQFESPKLPFFVIQLPDYATDWGGIYWQWMRESQANAIAATPGTALVMGINTNDGWDLHPQGKHEIGRRAALLIRKNVYNEDIIAHGPTFKEAKVEGSTIRVTFDTQGDGLSSGSSAVNGFMIAGDDGKYTAADATIDGDSVIVQSADVKEPKTVRYAFSGVPMSTLTNKSGLIAEPFRTDDQPISKNHGEAQRLTAGYTFRAKEYRLILNGEGKVTSYVARNQQFLSNAPDQWGGSSIGNRNLPRTKMAGLDTIECSNNDTILTLSFTDDSTKWTLENKNAKEGVKFHVALAAGVEATQAGTSVTLKRKNVTMNVSGVDTLMTFKDVAADTGKVLEIDVPSGAKKTIEFTFAK